MSQTLNPDLVAAVTPVESGVLYLDRQRTLLSDPIAWPSAIAAGDQIQIGVIPGGAVLVPQLSTLQLPILDSNDAATASFTIGIGTAADGIAAAQGGGAAVTLGPGDLKSGGSYGSATDDLPIFATFSAAAATPAAVGEVIADLVFRDFRPDVDKDYGAGVGL